MGAHKFLDRDKICKMYSDGLIVSEISKNLGCSREIIYYFLRKSGLEVRKYKRHGTRLTHNRLYKTWYSLVRRCINENDASYKDYGGRGIYVCDEWKGSFDVFAEWALSNGYSSELELDRADNNDGYGPLNCRWVTRTVNQRNRRDIVLSPAIVSAARIAVSAKIKTPTEVALFFGVNPDTIYSAVTRRTWKDILP